MSSYRVLERIAASTEEDAHSFYNCPVCRKPQLMGVESLQVGVQGGCCCMGLCLGL